MRTLQAPDKLICWGQNTAHLLFLVYFLKACVSHLFYPLCIYIRAAVYFKECFIFFQPAFFLLLLFFMRFVVPQLFFLCSSFSFDEDATRCHGCMNHCVLVLFFLFTPFLVWNLSLQILLLLLKAVWCHVKLNSNIQWFLTIAVPHSAILFESHNSHEMVQDFPLWIAKKCCLALFLKECEGNRGKVITSKISSLKIVQVCLHKLLLLLQAPLLLFLDSYEDIPCIIQTTCFAFFSSALHLQSFVSTFQIPLTVPKACFSRLATPLKLLRFAPPRSLDKYSALQGQGLQGKSSSVAHLELAECGCK